jgi:manganese/zinc/iron transport system substrate-binding protein
LLPLFSAGDLALIEQNYIDYTQELTDLKTWALEQMGFIPEERRVLITSHDAFAYFSQYFGLEAYALQGISTEDEVSLQDIRVLADFIVSNNVPAIFAESSVSPKSLEALQDAVVSRGWNLRIPETELFSDALGEVAPENTYIGMLRHNVSTIVQYLGEIPSGEGN